MKEDWNTYWNEDQKTRIIAISASLGISEPSRELTYDQAEKYLSALREKMFKKSRERYNAQE